MSIESSMGWWRALRWERRRTEINDYCSAEQPRRTESRNEAAIDTAWRGGERTDGPIATPETSGGEF